MFFMTNKRAFNVNERRFEYLCYLGKLNRVMSVAAYMTYIPHAKIKSIIHLSPMGDVGFYV